MANHPSAKKRHRQNIKRRDRNRAMRSRMRKAVKEARVALSDNAEGKGPAVDKAVRELYHAASKNVIPTNSARRTVSRLMKAVSRT